MLNRGLNPVCFEELAVVNVFALYLLCEGLLQQPFVIKYLPKNKSLTSFSSSAMLLRSQLEPECFLTGKGMLTSL